MSTQTDTTCTNVTDHKAFFDAQDFTHRYKNMLTGSVIWTEWRLQMFCYLWNCSGGDHRIQDRPGL